MEYRAFGKSRLLGKVVYKVSGWEAHYRPSACEVYAVVTEVPYGIFIPYKEKGDAVNRMPCFECTGRVRKDVIVVFRSLRWGSPSRQENILHHHHITAPAMRCRTHISAFALTVYRHNPDGTPIVAARFLGSTAWRCRGRFHGAHLYYLYT